MPTAAPSKPTSWIGADGIHSVVRGKPVRRRHAALHRLHLLRRGMAPIDAVPGRHQHQRTARSGWVRRPRGALSGATRRAINIVAHFDSDAWTEESWTRECDVCGSDDGLCRMEPRPHSRLSVQHPLVQMGAVRSRSAAALEQRPRHAAWRFRARHAALSRHRRRHRARRRLRAGGGGRAAAGRS